MAAGSSVGFVALASFNYNVAGVQSFLETGCTTVQNCMFLASFVVMGQVVLVLIVGFVNGLDNVETD